MGKVICVGNQKGGVGYGKLYIMRSWYTLYAEIQHFLID